MFNASYCRALLQMCCRCLDEISFECIAMYRGSRFLVCISQEKGHNLGSTSARVPVATFRGVHSQLTTLNPNPRGYLNVILYIDEFVETFTGYVEGAKISESRWRSILMTSQAILNSRFSDASETSLSIQVSSGRNIRSLILRQGRVK